MFVILTHDGDLFSEPPVIDSFHFSKRKQGDRVVVSCVVSTGDLPIEITWKKDGKSIRQGESGIRIQV